MTDIAKLTGRAGIILISGLTGIVLWKLMTGDITVNGLLRGDAKSATGEMAPYFSPGRVQMLMITILSAGYYLLQVIHDPSHLPEIPTPILVGVAGSHAIYLGGKAQAMFLSRARDLLLNRRQS